MKESFFQNKYDIQFAIRAIHDYEPLVYAHCPIVILKLIECWNFSCFIAVLLARRRWSNKPIMAGNISE